MHFLIFLCLSIAITCIFAFTFCLMYFVVFELFVNRMCSYIIIQKDLIFNLNCVIAMMCENRRLGADRLESITLINTILK